MQLLSAMSRRGFAGSSGSYNVRASELARERRGKTIHCVVHFLDDTQHTFELEKRAFGAILLDRVFLHLELVEKDYFGLRFYENGLNCNGDMRWLDPAKTIKKQMRSAVQPYTFYFKVKFYVSDPSKLQEEYTRYHFFLQIKRDMLEGHIMVPPTTACLLASYSAQSELGDYCYGEHGPNYLSELHLVPNQNAEMERKICELHKLHKGQTPADAEFNFLDHAKRLDMYGVDLHRARDSTNTDILLGVASCGLVVFQNSIKINTFSWAKIVKISFKRKQFFIQLRREAHENYDSLLGFNMLSYRSCKTLWKSCVEHHTFFRLHTPRPPLKKYFFLLGSKFYYSGRTEYQTVEEGKRQARTERSFVRSPSKRVLHQTLPSIAKEAEEKKQQQTTAKASVVRANGTTVHPPTLPRPYDTFNNKVVSATGHEPRKAWQELHSPQQDAGFLTEPSAFTPRLQARIGYVDDEEGLPADLGYELPSYADVMKNGHDEEHGLVVIRMKPDEQGRFGFNVKGGADQGLPILVSRVAPNTPADKSLPRLSEGDQVLAINTQDVSRMSHDQVVQLIRSCREMPHKELVLTVRPNVYNAEEEVEEPAFQYVPDIPHLARLPHVDVLGESMLLLSEGLESGATVAQFEQLYRRKPGMSMNAAKLSENIAKNRYRDISPYDQTRVIIQGGLNGDYINANHINMEIPALGIVNRYIAAQGPLPHTCGDFWQMIWEQQSSLVVMLTSVLERGRIKCHQYWPAIQESQNYGNLRVTCIREQETMNFAFREFTLMNNQTEEERHITQMQYIAWPDHGVPDQASDFVDFVLRVRSQRIGMVEPTIVHCSAGIGRTGVLILMETAMCLIEANEPVYPLDIVRNMRDQRAMLIQNASQYKFVCEAIVKVFNDHTVQPLPEFLR